MPNKEVPLDDMPSSLLGKEVPQDDLDFGTSPKQTTSPNGAGSGVPSFLAPQANTESQSTSESGTSLQDYNLTPNQQKPKIEPSKDLQPVKSPYSVVVKNAEDKRLLNTPNAKTPKEYAKVVVGYNGLINENTKNLNGLQEKISYLDNEIKKIDDNVVIPSLHPEAEAAKNKLYFEKINATQDYNKLLASRQSFESNKARVQGIITDKERELVKDRIESPFIANFFQSLHEGNEEVITGMKNMGLDDLIPAWMNTDITDPKNIVEQTEKLAKNKKELIKELELNAVTNESKAIAEQEKEKELGEAPIRSYLGQTAGGLTAPLLLAAGSAVTGTEGAALPVLNGAFFGTLGYGASMAQGYDEARKLGYSEEESYELAKNAARIGGTVQGVLGMVMGQTGEALSGLNPLNKAVTGEVTKNAIKQGIVDFGLKAVGTGTEFAGARLAENIGQKYLNPEVSGNKDITEGVAKSFGKGVLLHTTMTAMHAPKQILGKASLINAVNEAKTPEDVLELTQSIQQAKENKFITEGMAIELTQKVGRVKEALDIVPDQFTDTDVREKATELILRHQDVEDKLKKTPELLKPMVADELKAINVQFEELRNEQLEKDKVAEKNYGNRVVEQQLEFTSPENGKGTDVVAEEKVQGGEEGVQKVKTLDNYEINDIEIPDDIESEDEWQSKLVEKAFDDTNLKYSKKVAGTGTIYYTFEGKSGDDVVVRLGNHSKGRWAGREVDANVVYDANSTPQDVLDILRDKLPDGVIVKKTPTEKTPTSEVVETKTEPTTPIEESLVNLEKNGTNEVEKTDEEKLSELQNLPDEEFIKKFVNSGMYNSAGEVFDKRFALGMSTKEVQKGVADIQKGKMETAPAKKLIAHILDIKAKGDVSMIEGTGGKTVVAGMKLSDLHDLLINAPTELTKQEAEASINISEDLSNEIEKQGVTLETIDNMIKNHESQFPFSLEDLQTIKKHLEDERNRETASGDVENEADATQGKSDTENKGEAEQEVENNGNKPPTSESQINISSEEPSKTGITHKQTNKTASEIGLEQYESTPETVEQWDMEADRRLRENSGTIPKLLKKLEQGTLPDNIDQRVMLRYMSSLEAKIKESPTNELIAEYKRARDLSDKVGGTEVGRALAARKGAVDVTNSLADMMVDFQESLGVDNLTETQKAEIQAKYYEIQSAKANAEAKIKQLEAELEKYKADKEFKKEVDNARKQTRKVVREKLDEEFSELKNEFKKLIGGQLSAGINPNAIPIITKMVANRAKVGITKLSDVIDAVHEQLKEFGISKKDIQDVIAGEYNEKKEHINDIKSSIRQLQEEAKLLNELERLENGGEPLTEKKKVEKNQQLTELRKKIASYSNEVSEADKEAKRIEGLQDKLDKILRGEAEQGEPKKVDSDEVKDLKEQIKEAKQLMGLVPSKPLPPPNKLRSEIALNAIKNRNKLALSKLEKKIADKDYTTERKLSPLDDPQAKLRFSELRAEALDALKKREDARHQWEIDKHNAELKQRTPIRKAFDYSKHAITTLRAIKAGIDFSAVFIQNGLAVLANPKAGGKAYLSSMQDTFSDKRFERELTALHNSEIWDLIKQSGLNVLEPKSIKEREREGVLDYNLLNENFTVLGKELNVGKYTTKPFERAFTSMGNNLRVNLFSKAVERLQSEGKSIETDLQEYKDAAEVINTMTGRGTLHPLAENELTGFIVWSPRLLASGFNLLGIGDVANLALKTAQGGKGNFGYYAKLTPSARKYAISQTVKGIGMGVAIMAAAAYGGADVDDDPESVTFGNIKFAESGNSYNIFGRFTPIVRLIVSSITGKKKVDGKNIETSRDKTLSRFVRGKFTPLIGTVADYWTGKTYMGEDVTTMGEIHNMVDPLSLSEIKKGLEQEGASSLLTRALPSIHGIKVTSEKDFEDLSDPSVKEFKESTLYKDIPEGYQKEAVAMFAKKTKQINSLNIDEDKKQENILEARKEVVKSIENKQKEDKELDKLKSTLSKAIDAEDRASILKDELKSSEKGEPYINAKRREAKYKEWEEQGILNEETRVLLENKMKSFK